MQTDAHGQLADQIWAARRHKRQVIDAFFSVPKPSPHTIHRYEQAVKAIDNELEQLQAEISRTRN